MDAAWDLGITTFDTADAYGGGRSETFIGEWLRTKGSDVRDRLVVATKTFNPMEAGADAGLGRTRIPRQLETSLQRLGVERVPLYLAHDFDTATPQEETLAAFDRLVRAGKVGAVGASNFTAEQLAEALELSALEGLTRYEWAQNSFSLLELGDVETVFPLCREHGLGYTPFSPLAGGWLTGKYRRGEEPPPGSRMTLRPEPYAEYSTGRVFDALERFAERATGLGISPAGLALAWALSVPDVTAVVIGPNRPEQLGPAVEALGAPLTPASTRRPGGGVSMSLLVLDESDVRALLDMESCVEAMADVLAELERGEASMPLRFVMRPPQSPPLFGLMPAHRGGRSPVFSLKEIVIAPANRERGLDPHQGAVLLHDGETGVLQALLNASAVTEIRTAAVSGVATRLLARPGARRVAILGAGIQARSHVAAMRAVLTEPEIVLWGRTPERAQALAAEVGVEWVPTVEEAVSGAEVVCTTSAAAEPILRREHVAPGTHVNAVGSSVPTAREVDAATIAASSLFADRRESVLAEGGDYLLAVAEVGIGPEHIVAELGELLVGSHPGRTADEEITVFKSLGLAVEDLAAAELCVARARERGIGTKVEF